MQNKEIAYFYVDRISFLDIIIYKIKQCHQNSLIQEIMRISTHRSINRTNGVAQSNLC